MIEISSNLKIVNFLDVALYLNDNSYKPLGKVNAIPTYINVSSHHPSFIVKQILNAINIRINKLSFSKNILIKRNFIMKPYITYLPTPLPGQDMRQGQFTRFEVRVFPSPRLDFVGNGHGDTSSNPGRN